ncbi:MAG: tetratricopeptide repeat protein [Actinomycetes bacterium]
MPRRRDAGDEHVDRGPRVPDPALPDDVTGAELDQEVRADLRSLSKEGASAVARHLVMVARLVDSDPELAWQHAQAARRRAGRLGAVREAVGLAAYHAGHYDEALRELRTARRLTGNDVHLPVMADCERGLGRPERALALASSADAKRLDRAGQVEMRIVAAGARMDMGNPEAAVVLLRQAAQKAPASAPWRARVYSALSDALEASGRRAEAREWLERAAAADLSGETGAFERLTGESGAEDEVIDLLDDDGDGQERA